MRAIQNLLLIQCKDLFEVNIFASAIEESITKFTMNIMKNLSFRLKFLLVHRGEH